MNRPYLVNFSAITSNSKIYIKAKITISDTSMNKSAMHNVPSTPIQSIKLLSKNLFRIKVKGLSDKNEVIFDKDYDTDSYGNFELQISETINQQNIKNLMLFETITIPKVQIHLGSIIPVIINIPKKIIISDFDKTLVDTKYSTLKEMYYSLNRPLNYFPTVNNSVDILQGYINNNYQPFILSASPHFYENAIRDWLYQNNIYTSSIFLKDYRDFISLFSGKLATKDLKKHGFYKLNQLVEILMMTGIPDDLVLIGDGFESDPFIYLTLRSLLIDHVDPWKLWESIKNHRIFNLNTKQDSYFLTKFYRLSELSRQKNQIKMEIYIRATRENIQKLQSEQFSNPFILNKPGNINYYIADIKTIKSQEQKA